MTPRWNVKGGLRVAIDASFATRAIAPFRPPALMIALLTKGRSDAGLTRAGLGAAKFVEVARAIGVDPYKVMR